MKPAKKQHDDAPPAGVGPADDWFFDELMTAQPEATQEYFRARLRQPALLRRVREPGK